MKKGDKASPSIILAGRALLVKMLITLEPHYASGSNFEYSFLLFSFLLFSIFFFSFIFSFLFIFFSYLFFEYLCSLTLSSYC